MSYQGSCRLPGKGFTEPVLGASKAAIINDPSAKKAYDRASENGNSFVSDQEYQGQDSDGKKVTIKFECSSTAGSPRTFWIVQAIY